MPTRIQIRRDTHERWTSVNPVLGIGEPALDTTSGDFRVGDGATHFLDLPAYVTIDAASNLLPDRVMDEFDDRYGVIVRVEQFGAVGDGIVDDTAAVQAAVTSLSTFATGGAVHLRAGSRYSIPGVILLPSNVTVEGNGAEVVKIAGSPQRLVFSNKSAEGAVGYGAGGRNITLRRIRFIGDYTIPVANYKDIGVGFNHVSNLTIDQCWFEQGMNNSHYIDLLGCTNVRIINSDFRGMRPRSGREYIEAIQIDVSTRQGTSYDDETPSSFDGLPTRGVLVTGCTFGTVTVAGTTYGNPNPIGSHAAALGTEAGYYQNVRFHSNTVEGFNTPATNDSFGWLHFRGIRGLDITDNTFVYTGPSGVSGNPCVISVIPTTTYTPADQVQNASPTSATLGTPQAAQRVTILGNRFVGFGSAPSLVDSGLINLDSVVGAVVQGNVVDGSSSSFLRAVSTRVTAAANDVVLSSTEPGFRISGCTSPQVVQNVISGYAGGVAVQTDRGGNVRVSDNTIVGGAVGVRSNGADGSLIQNNFIRDFTATGISIGETGYGFTHFDCVVSGNRVRTTATSTTSLLIGATSTRARRYGNVWRDPGVVTDNGSGTTTVATDQIS